MNKDKDSDKNKTPKKKINISRTGYIAAIAFLVGAIGVGTISYATKDGHVVGYINDGSNSSNDDYVTEEYIDDEYSDDEYSDDFVATDQDNYYDIVNDSIYNKLKEAKKNFDILYSNGEVSTQLKEKDINLGDGEYSYIDEGMKHVYNDICSYIENYDNGNYDACYDSGKCLSDDYVTVMSPQYLYSFLVVPKLGNDYQADFYQYDSDGNITLNNDKKIHLIGEDDSLIRISEGDDITTRFDYYIDLPIIILDNYQVITNTNGDDGICYIMNISNTDRLCRKDIAEIKNNASEVYDIPVDDLAITWNEEANSWEYRDNNVNEDIALLDYDANARFNTYWEIEEAIGSGSADVYELDAAVDSLQSKYGKIKE